MQVFQATGRPLDTKQIASSNSAQGLPTAYMGATATRITLTGFDRGAYGALITCETADIRFSYNSVTPTQAGLGHILAAGSSIMLDGEEQVNGFKFISKTADTPATLTVTPFIAYGR